MSDGNGAVQALVERLVALLSVAVDGEAHDRVVITHTQSGAHHVYRVQVGTVQSTRIEHYHKHD